MQWIVYNEDVRTVLMMRCKHNVISVMSFDDATIPLTDCNAELVMLWD